MNSNSPYRQGLDAAVGAFLTVDLGAIARNYKKLCEIASGAQVMATVKADAYGLGIKRVGPALAEAGCRSFFVALATEGATLRQALDDENLAGDIYILNGLVPGTEAVMRAAALVPVLNTRPQIEAWRTSAPSLRCALHIDTGMNRLGLSPQEAAALQPTDIAGLNLSLVMSHLACADTPDDPKSEDQRNLFETLSKPFQGIPKSLCNSAGILLGAPFHLDAVRPGIALFGGMPSAEKTVEFEPVVRLSSKILQVRQIDKDQTVGYGATYRASKPMRVATLGIGYADGYRWGLGGKAQGFVGDSGVPVLGRISMDLTAVDVTNLPDDAVGPGATVTLLDNRVTINDAADIAQTIPYEILTGLGSRLQRSYIDVTDSSDSMTSGVRT